MRRKLTSLIIAPGLLGFIQPAAAEPPLAAEPSAAEAATAPAVVPDGPEAGMGPLRAGGTAAPSGDTLDALLREAEDRVRALSQPRGADPAAAARAELALARERIAALEAARAEDGATIARLRADLDQMRSRVMRLSQELDASWLWVEELNAILASLGALPPVPGAGAADTGAGAGEDRTAGDRTTAALAPPPPPPPPAVAATPIPLGAVFAAVPPTAAGRDDGTPAAATADAPYTVVRAVNLRAAPRITADVVAVIERGTLVRRMGSESQRGWLRVTYTDRASRDLTGWVFEDFLRPANGPSPNGDARSGTGG